MSRRVQRVEKEIRNVVASYLLTGLKDPLMGLVSVSRVMVSGDLKNAKVYVSVMSDDNEDREENIAVLQSRAGDIQRQIHSQLRMKFCPKLKFYLDQGLDHQLKIDQILHDISGENTED